MKKFFSVLIIALSVLVLCSFSVFAADNKQPTAEVSFAAPNGVRDDIGSLFEELRLRREQGNGLTFDDVLRIIVRINRDSAECFKMQFLTKYEIDAAVDKIVDKTVFYDSRYDLEAQPTVTAGIEMFLPECRALYNRRVLQGVCREYERLQYECVPADTPGMTFTTYEHYVGELMLHFILYNLLDATGGFDGPFPDIYFRVSTAELSQLESRYTEFISFLSKILA